MPRKTAAQKAAAKVEVLACSDAELDGQLIEAVPDAFSPGYEGYMLRVAGAPWAEVANAIGSPSQQAAVATVSAYLRTVAAAQSAQQQQEAMQLAVDRYETVLREWWVAGTKGKDDKAAGIVLRALERLDRLQRLTDGDMVVTKETIVVSADRDEYIRQLQQVVEDREGNR